jgi:hypothetical protein
MVFAYAAMARTQRRTAPMTEGILDVRQLKNLLGLVTLGGAAGNREFRFANRPPFSFGFIEGSSRIAELSVQL